jgi:segregation and condensation protein A
MEEKLLSMLTDDQELSWKAIIYDLIKTEGMDPWNLNVGSLSKMYLKQVRKLKELDLQVSGKVILAASILLKIKSSRLIGEDLLEFDRLLATPADEADGDEFYDELEDELAAPHIPLVRGPKEEFPIYPRTPQARKRRVSIFDLVGALEKALEVKDRRQNRIHGIEVERPTKTLDIKVVLANVFNKIKSLFSSNKSVNFNDLLETKSPEEIVSTFIPVLYLSNEQKVELTQEEPFGEISIRVLEEAKV